MLRAPLRALRSGRRGRLLRLAPLAASLALLSFTATASAAPALVTDKADYAPGEVVHISGTGFISGETYAMPVKRPDGSIVVVDELQTPLPGWGFATADAAGNLAYDYVLDGMVGTYEAGAYSADWSGDWSELSVASVAFTGAVTRPPTIQSDQPDYNPGATVTLTGENWVPGELVHIVVNDDVGQTWTRSVDVVANADGTIRDQFQLPSYFVATYRVTASGPISGTATTTFTDAIGYDLNQCQNINLSHLSEPCGTGALTGSFGWENGNVGSSNSQYREGDGLPYRAPISGLTNGTWVVGIEYDFTKGGVFAFDRLTGTTSRRRRVPAPIRPSAAARRSP